MPKSSYDKLMSSTGAPGGAGTVEWSTPQYLVDQWAEEFAPGGVFDLDPCASPENFKADRWFGIADDSLNRDWCCTAAFMNPPYGKYLTPAWLAKAKSEVDLGHAGIVVCLVPARVGTRWYAAYEQDPSVLVRVLGRIRYDQSRRGESPFDHALVCFFSDPNEAKKHGSKSHWCAQCGRRFWPLRSDALCCSDKCRRAKSRAKKVAA